MGDFEKVVAQYEAFKRDFDAGQYDECSKKVTQLKLAMMGLSVSFLHAGSVSEASLKEFLLCSFDSFRFFISGWARRIL